MNERKKIENIIRKKEEEIQSLKEQLREASVYVKALQDVLKILPRDAESQAESSARLRPGSSAAVARDIILKKGKPVHLNDLLQEMGKDINRGNRASLSSSLAAYVRKGEIFSRPAPNRFGLVEMEHAGQEERSSEPPEDFGAFEEF